MHGRVTHTYVRGQPVVVEGDLVGGPGSGAFQPPVWRNGQRRRCQ